MTKRLGPRTLTNDVGMDIEKRIEQGKTLLFNEKNMAQAAANRLNSYVYDVFENGSTCGKYAVPR